jgi:hypothetical protein
MRKIKSILESESSFSGISMVVQAKWETTIFDTILIDGESALCEVMRVDRTRRTSHKSTAVAFESFLRSR